MIFLSFLEVLRQQQRQPRRQEHLLRHLHPAQHHSIHLIGTFSRGQGGGNVWPITSLVKRLMPDYHEFRSYCVIYRSSVSPYCKLRRSWTLCACKQLAMVIICMNG